MARPDATADYPGIHIEYFDAKHRYTLNDNWVPSPSGILGVLDKPALPPWAANITRDGAWELIRKDRSTRWLKRTLGDNFRPFMEMVQKGKRPVGTDNEQYAAAKRVLRPDTREPYMLPHRWDEFCADLKVFKLRHYDVTSGAQDRGTRVHAALEDWIDRGKVPNPSEFPKQERGYVRGLTKWLIDWQPSFQFSELMVGSVVHGFAGRLDTVARIPLESLPTGELKRLPAGTDDGQVMIDLKTSKGVYPRSHFRQLSGYELAAVECGFTPTVAQGVLRVGEDGEYQVVWSVGKPEHFLNCLAVWHDNRELPERA